MDPGAMLPKHTERWCPSQFAGPESRWHGGRLGEMRLAYRFLMHSFKLVCLNWIYTSGHLGHQILVYQEVDALFPRKRLNHFPNYVWKLVFPNYNFLAHTWSTHFLWASLCTVKCYRDPGANIMAPVLSQPVPWSGSQTTFYVYIPPFPSSGPTSKEAYITSVKATTAFLISLMNCCFPTHNQDSPPSHKPPGPLNGSASSQSWLPG